MTTTASTPFARRVDDALRQAQTVLSLSPDGLTGGEAASLNDMLRRLREEIVEPEIAKTPTTDKPIGLALSVTEAEAHANVLGALGAGSTVIVAPTDVQRAALTVVALRLRSQIDQHAGRVAQAPPAPPTPPSPAEASL